MIKVNRLRIGMNRFRNNGRMLTGLGHRYFMKLSVREVGISIPGSGNRRYTQVATSNPRFVVVHQYITHIRFRVPIHGMGCLAIGPTGTSNVIDIICRNVPRSTCKCATTTSLHDLDDRNTFLYR